MRPKQKGNMGSSGGLEQQRPDVQIVSVLWSSKHMMMGKAMASHSSTLAWKTPWMEEPGRLQSMGSLRVGYD